MRSSLFGEVTRLRDRNFDTGCSSTAHRQDVQVKRETGERWLWQPYLNPRTARDPEAAATSFQKTRQYRQCKVMHSVRKLLLLPSPAAGRQHMFQHSLPLSCQCKCAWETCQRQALCHHNNLHHMDVPWVYIDPTSTLPKFLPSLAYSKSVVTRC